MRFDDILLTVDFDRTLTGPDSVIPKRNLEAIEYFMANGGAFTVNTGRSTSTFWQYLQSIPVNAPFLLYNGSAAYEKGELTQLCPIDLDPWETMAQVLDRFGDMNLEIQGTTVHYLINPSDKMIALYDNLQWRYTRANFGDDVGPFLKFSLFGDPDQPVVSPLFSGSEEELRRFDEAEAALREMYGDKVEVFRAAPRIIDIHAKGVSKINAARKLQATLGRNILVCVGDAENDIPMLDGADYAFCPADGVVADRYETVCDCGSGAVADVIYKKIREIVANHP
jgi:HAD superfamily hydrolase (TIGR01484 family)